MSIDALDEKLAVMQMGMPFAPAVVLNETSGFSQGDKQQLVWGYPGVLWSELVVGFGVLIESITVRPAVQGRMSIEATVEAFVDIDTAIDGLLETVE